MTWSNEQHLNARESVRNQYLAAIVANMLSFGYGLGLGWASPNVPFLLSTESPMVTGPITMDQSTWISSMFCLGGPFGTVAYSLLIDVIGRKWSLVIIGIPHAMSWLLIAFVLNVNALLVARFLFGFSAGGMFVVIPVFVTEIANDRIRGTLGNFMGLNVCLGTLLAFMLSHCFSYSIMPSVGFVLTSVFLSMILWFPDTPQSLKLRMKTKQVERSVEFYKRKESTDAWKCEEKKPMQIIEDNGKITIADLIVPTTRKGILLGCMAIGMTQFCGSFAIINYTASIFHVAGSTLHPNVCAMVIALIQVVAAMALISLIDKAGRKIILMVSSALTAAFHILLGLFFFFQSYGYDMSNWSWLPLVSLSGLMFFVIGISSTAVVVAVEVLPPKLRSSVPGVILTVSWFTAFLFVRYFNTMVYVLEMYGSLWLFALCCIINFVVVAYWMPETKGKDYEEIRKMMMSK